VSRNSSQRFACEPGDITSEADKESPVGAVLLELSIRYDPDQHRARIYARFARLVSSSLLEDLSQASGARIGTLLPAARRTCCSRPVPCTTGWYVCADDLTFRVAIPIVS
jgi:hypothetical protein